MSAEESVREQKMVRSPAASTTAMDLTAIVVCTLAWGTTWFAITLQLGVVDPVVSLTYRFALSAALLFAWSAFRRERIALTRAQHIAAFGLGFFTFGVNYTLVYWAEQWVTSAVVAVLFASMAFVNLAVFRLVFGQRAPVLAWAASGLGVIGVALLSWTEVVGAQLDQRAILGIVLTLVGVLGAAIGNVFARNGEVAGAAVAPYTGWAMGYGALLLALFATATGKTWTFEPTFGYVASLIHLSLNGSVIAFLLYYGLARRRGYTTASYISALAPPLAMLVSSLFEAKTWGPFALAGVALVLAGQYLLLRAKRT
ncbi:DMT family transporter [Terricaulis sp.]|uniref:DMT family transporter n=1 Tax=Terricaulis sp. TaxID=2768686 RepID=UPI003783796F